MWVSVLRNLICVCVCVCVCVKWSPWGLSGKEFTCQADVGSIPGLGRSPGEGNDNKFHEERSLESYRPGVIKESDTT